MIPGGKANGRGERRGCQVKRRVGEIGEDFRFFRPFGGAESKKYPGGSMCRFEFLECMGKAATWNN